MANFWTVKLAGELQHILPVDDERMHTLDINCPCKPVEDSDFPEIIIHNAYDRREVIEELEAKLKE